ncbi:hypothetical protein [Paenibacillus hexagrammi]|uniref:Uncharacterized protein n=1 Tax=Paenibacillus hexagrammi TaxID=2908839 RepID=A0ABY3SGS6_9BACL|nr:hypothetical protein [Paenibacillus sp. YPD9-1]UJF33202.1 hypothetical protein L0M14_27325 [Paenibacillus sp. YPD9-1]
MSRHVKSALIVRSASFQQLDKNLPELEAFFPEHEFSMLTHEHGVQLAEKYKVIKHIYVYPYKASFSYWRKFKAANLPSVDAVIVPVANITGAGFFNVLLFSLSIRAKKRYLCNMISEIKEFSVVSVLLEGVLNLLYKLLAALFSLLVMIPTVLLLLVFLKKIDKKT